MFEGWEPWGGTMMKRPTGAIVSDRAGVATPYALHHLQPRGSFFLGPGADVYEGMIIGEHNRPNDTDVNRSARRSSRTSATTARTRT